MEFLPLIFMVFSLSIFSEMSSLLSCLAAKMISSITASALARTLSSDKPAKGCGTIAKGNEGILKPLAVILANEEKSVVQTVRVGSPFFFFPPEWGKSHDVQDPQSPVEAITRSHPS